jgi:hypothetical protein
MSGYIIDLVLVTFRFTLIYGNIVAVLRTFSTLRAWQRMVVMNFLEPMKDRDDAIENGLRGLIPDNVPDFERQRFERQIHQAIEQGVRNFGGELSARNYRRCGIHCQNLEPIERAGEPVNAQSAQTGGFCSEDLWLYSTRRANKQIAWGR